MHDPELLLIAPALKLLTRKPVIYDIHEYYPEAILAKPWLPGVLRLPTAKAYALLERLLLPFVDALVQPTETLVDLYRSSRKPNALVANYAAREQFPERDRRSVPTRTVVYAGSLSPIRGIGLLLEAMPRVLAACPDARLRIAGTAVQSSYGDELKARAAALGVLASVDFLGWVPFPRVREILYESSVGAALYLPTADSDRGYPTKLFEYMAAGLPCVSSDILPCRRIVNATGCGMVVDPINTKAVADAFIHLLRYPEEANEMGRRGRAAFLAKYTWEGEAEKLVGLYQRLLHDRVRHRRSRQPPQAPH